MARSDSCSGAEETVPPNSEAIACGAPDTWPYTWIRRAAWELGEGMRESLRWS